MAVVVRSYARQGVVVGTAGSGYCALPYEDANDGKKEGLPGDRAHHGGTSSHNGVERRARTAARVQSYTIAPTVHHRDCETT